MKSGYLSYHKHSGLKVRERLVIHLLQPFKHSLQIRASVLRSSILLPGRVRNDHFRQCCSRQPMHGTLHQDKAFFPIAKKVHSFRSNTKIQRSGIAAAASSWDKSVREVYITNNKSQMKYSLIHGSCRFHDCRNLNAFLTSH